MTGREWAESGDAGVSANAPASRTRAPRRTAITTTDCPTEIRRRSGAPSNLRRSSEVTTRLAMWFKRRSRAHFAGERGSVATGRCSRGSGLETERPRSRTEPAWGCQTSPVLKTSARLTDLQGFSLLVGRCAPVRAPVRRGASPEPARRRPRNSALLKGWPFSCRAAGVRVGTAGRGDGDRDGQAAVVAGAGGGGAAVDRGDGRDDGEAESEAVVGGAVVEPLERLEDAVGVRRADERAGVRPRSARCSPRSVRVLIQMSPPAAL